MTAGVPWSVNAVERETWAAARDAARRAGLSVGEWLEQTIREGADEPRARRAPREQPRTDALEQRLDDISDKLDPSDARLDTRTGAPRGRPHTRSRRRALDGRVKRMATIGGPTPRSGERRRRDQRPILFFLRAGENEDLPRSLTAESVPPRAERRLDALSQRRRRTAPEREPERPTEHDLAVDCRPRRRNRRITPWSSQAR